MRDRIAYGGARLLAGMIRLIPLPAALAFARVLARAAYFFDRRQKIAYVNLKAAFPNKTGREIKFILRNYYKHFAQVLFEVFYFSKFDRRYFDRYIRVENFSRYEKAVKDKSGAMLVTAHFGNWELLQICSGILGNPLRVLAREQKMTRLDEFLNELRASHGSRPIFTKGIQLRELFAALKQGGLVGVLGDQSGGREGAVVRFFGRKTTAPAGIMTLAQRTGAQVIPCFAFRKDGPYHQIDVIEPLELQKTRSPEADDAENCSRFLRQLETYTAQHPEQWLWGYKRWKFCFTKRILVLEDEKMGHATQAKAVARELAGLFPKLSAEYEIDVKSIPIRFPSAFHQAAFFVFAFLLGPFAQGKLGILRYFLTPESFREIASVSYADFIISCGARLVPLNRWLRSEFLSKSVVVMKPPFPYFWVPFDLVVMPKHDKVYGSKGGKVQTVMSPNLVDHELLESARLDVLRQVSLNGKSRLSVFIGGSSKRYRFNQFEFERWLSLLKEAAGESETDLLVTTSRRTTPEMDAATKRVLAEDPRCKLLVIANEKNIRNVTYGMLALSDTILVTEDSVSMISEALASGKRVLVLKLGNGKLSAKFRRLQEILVDEGLIQVASARDFKTKWETLKRLELKPDFVQNEREKIREALRHLT